MNGTPDGAIGGGDASVVTEEQAEIDRYCNYQPSKLKDGRPHPDIIVESASLATTAAPDISADYSSLKDDWEGGKISNAQLESVAYAMQRFKADPLPGGSKPGFFLGDGAGVGKGRQIAALIKALWLPRKTCRILWLSVSNDLREDARRDMRDLGLTILEGGGGPVRGNALEIVVWPKANDTLALPAGHKIGRYVGEGVLFGTYHMLIAGTCGVVSKSAAAVQKRKEAKQKYAAETP